MVTRDFAKFRDETPNPISLNQRVLGSSPSASTKIYQKINGLEQSPAKGRNTVSAMRSACIPRPEYRFADVRAGWKIFAAVCSGHCNRGWDDSRAAVVMLSQWPINTFSTDSRAFKRC